MEDSSYYGWARNGLLVRVFSILTILAVLVSMWAFVAPQPAGAAGNIEEIHEHTHGDDIDNRAGRLQPTTAQLSAVSKLGASATWNKFGTPKSLIKYGGYLGASRGDTATQAALNWIIANRGLFRLPNATANSFRLVNESRFRDGHYITPDVTRSDPRYGEPRFLDAYAVLFRQNFAGVSPTRDGQIVVGIVGTAAQGWKVAYVSSSISGNTTLAAQPTLTATQAWLKATAAIGHTEITASKITRVVPDRKKNGQLNSDWTLLQVTGLSDPQRVRLSAVPTPLNGVRPAYETIYLHNKDGHAEAWTSFVDAANGNILTRTSNVQQLANFAPTAAPLAANTATPYSGATTATACGPEHVFTVSGTETRNIVVTAAAAVTTNDIDLQLYKGAGPTKERIPDTDVGLSPEVIVYEPDGGVTPGKYTVQVCPFKDSINPIYLPPYNYAGTFITSDQPLTEGIAYPPKWRYFRSNPTIPISNTDNRILACWDTVIGGDPEGDDDTSPNSVRVPGCQQDLDYVGLRSSKAPWDLIVQSNTPSFTTLGNNAKSAEAWGSPLTPAEQFMPTSSNRTYDYRWTNQWNQQRCNVETTLFSPQRNDIDAATANLFVQHNRMHDWSYYLGFTEENFNMQLTNFGNGRGTPGPGAMGIGGREGDPEIGNVQAGAISGRPPGLPPSPDPDIPAGPLGRDNANQITLNDGIAPITNMYLWQPLPTGFYAPCVDGDYDMSVIAHEYGHAIQNRMSAGPDDGLSGMQARSMGESWSDLTAVEFLAEFGYSMGLDRGGYPLDVNPFAVGPYVTGAKQTGIRNYGMNRSPLNYSNLEYDPNGVTSPHADGEIWSATNYDIRQLLVEKYNVPRFGYPAFPVTDKGLQQDCAAGRRPARFCPGNRRWIQIFHDAFLLQASGELTMLEARDSYLAADVMRFRGFNQTELWKAFARRGMGVFASSPAFKDAAGDDQPDTENLNATPNFRSPRENNTLVTFNVTPRGGQTMPKARIYVGDYEARAVPIADTDSATKLGNRAAFVGGTYKFLVVAPGYGFYRFTRTFAPNTQPAITLDIAMPVNYASKSNGASATGSQKFINKNKLIDDTETKNAVYLDNLGGTSSAPGPQVRGKQITVNLAGTAPTLVQRVQVSALLRPRDESDKQDDDDQIPEFGDTETQGRVTALRQFEIHTCIASAANSNCTGNTGFTKVFTSASDAFPADRPRPLAPNLLLKPFTMPANTKATHVRIVVVNSQCTGAPAYQGEQDNDPLNPKVDCSEYNGSPGNAFVRQNNKVRINELQVFSTTGAVSQR